MKAFTMGKQGIRTFDGMIRVGETGRGRSMTKVAIPPRSEVIDDILLSCDGPETSALVYIPDQSGFRGSWKLRDGLTTPEWNNILMRLDAHAPPYGDGEIAEGHDGYGSCAACDAIAKMPADRPANVKIIAEGFCAQGMAGRAGGGPEYLLVMKDGQAVEIVRSGRLYGAPKVIRLECVAGQVAVYDPIDALRVNIANSKWKMIIGEI